YVGTDIHRPAFELLRAREIRCADEFTMGDIHLSSGIRDRLGQSEIDDFYFYFSHSSVTRLKHDVVRLEITMDQTLSRSGRQRLRDLTRNSHNQLWTQRTVSSHTSL